jgi:hypothetical protein
MKRPRQVILLSLLSLLFFALFLYRQNDHQANLHTAEAVNWDDLALTGSLLAIEEVGAQRQVIQLHLSNGAMMVRFAAPPEAWIEGLALADNGSLVLTYAPPPSPPLARYSQTNLYQLEGPGNPQLLLAQAYPDDLFTQPVWSAEGGLYFTHYQPTSAGYSVAIERYQRQENSPTVVVQEATWPALSPDGQQMAYIHSDPLTDQHRLMLADIDGSNPRMLLGSEQFDHISAPFFAPQGCQVYFAAAEPSDHQGATSFWGVGSTSAHGDITLVNWWRIDCQGGLPERVTKLATIVQTGVFSPDGQWIAFTAVDGLYVMRADTREPIHIASFKAGDSIAWVP